MDRGFGAAVTTLNAEEHFRWKVIESVAKSKAERDLDIALKAVFGPAVVTKEMPIRIGGRTLFVDRVLQGLKWAFEVDGRQHDAYSAYHHRDKEGFDDSKLRDRMKEAWLRVNGYTIIRFKHNETITADLLRQRIAEAAAQEEEYE